jgi:integrase
MTVGDWLTSWLAGRIADGALSPRVAENYTAIVKQRLVPAIGRIRLQELRSDHVTELKASLVAAGLAPATVKKMLGVLRQSLEPAFVAGLIPRNPAASVPSPSVTTASAERRALREDEVGNLIAAASSSPFNVPIRLAIATGIRQAEALGLKWRDVDFDRGTLEVRQTLAYVGHEFRMVSPKTKNSRRTIELSEALIAVLRSHRAAQNEERLRLGPLWQDLDLVFPAPDGRPQYRQAFFRDYRRIVNKSGIEQPGSVNWHTLRHTAGSLWILHGVDIFTVSRRLGHASAAFTMDVYAHLLKGQQREAAVALDHLIAIS